MNKHSPLPWYKAKQASHEDILIFDKDGGFIAKAFGELDASLIVCVVNSHKELLDALKGTHKALCDACCPRGWVGEGPRPHASICKETAELTDKAEGKAMV